MSRLFRLAAGTVTLVGLALSWGFGPASLTPDYAARTLVYLGYFTVLTNYGLAAAWLLPVLAPATAAGRFFDRPGTRTVLLACIIIVSAVYYSLLAHLWNPRGLGSVSNAILHAVSPLLFAADWLFVVPRGRVPWTAAVTVLAFPAAYLVWVNGKARRAYRLPTAGEWKAIAAALPRANFKKLFDDPRLAWAADYGAMPALSGVIRPSGGFGALPNGISDLSGNVWEWTATCARDGFEPDRCPAYKVEGQHETALSVFVREPFNGGCAAGTPPNHVGLRLVTED